MTMFSRIHIFPNSNLTQKWVANRRREITLTESLLKINALRPPPPPATLPLRPSWPPYILVPDIAENSLMSENCTNEKKICHFGCSLHNSKKPNCRIIDAAFRLDEAKLVEIFCKIILHRDLVWIRITSIIPWNKSKKKQLHWRNPFALCSRTMKCHVAFHLLLILQITCVTYLCQVSSAYISQNCKRISCKL